MRAITHVLVVVATLIVTLEALGQCDSACVPPLSSGRQTSTLTVAFASVFDSSDMNAIVAGMDYWNGYFQNWGINNGYHFVFTGPGQINIVIDESLRGTATIADAPDNADGTGTMKFNPDYLGQGRSDLLQTVTGHELGHSLGFGHIWDSKCQGSTMMYAYIKASSGPFITSLTACDLRALETAFPHEPPPPTGGGDETPQCGGGGPYEDCSPIVINFHGEYDLTGADAPVWFDIRGTGTPVLLGWTSARSDEAFLWMDRNGNEAVDDGTELFGNATRLHNGQLAPNGFEVLREFDRNGDAVINATDSIWSALRLWRDVNHNGRSEAEELSMLTESTVKGISVRYWPARRRDRHGNEFRFESHVWLAGNHGQRVTRPVYDIFFVGVRP